MTSIHSDPGIRNYKITPENLKRVDKIADILDIAKSDKPNIDIYIKQILDIMKDIDIFIPTADIKITRHVHNIMNYMNKLSSLQVDRRQYITNTEIDNIFIYIKDFMHIDPEYRVPLKEKSKRRSSIFFNFVPSNKVNIENQEPLAPSLPSPSLSSPSLPVPPPYAKIHPEYKSAKGGKRRRSRKNKTRRQTRKTRVRSHKK